MDARKELMKTYILSEKCNKFEAIVKECQKISSRTFNLIHIKNVQILPEQKKKFDKKKKGRNLKVSHL